MPLRNYHILLIVTVVSLLCHLTARRTHSALVVGDAIDKIDSFYVDEVDRRELLESALSGLTSKLDEHSQFIPPQSFEQFEDFLAQEFAGVGILVEQPEEGQPVRVITPLVGSPALRAGVLPGDQIITVDGEDVRKLPLRDVSDRLRGPIETEVVIEVLRDEESQETIKVVREQIPLDSIVGDYRDEQSRWVFRLKGQPRIAMIRCTSFGEKTVGELRRTLLELDNDFDGLVFDLRGNAGGLLNAAVDVCDMFIEEGEIVSTRGRDPSRKASSDWATRGTLVDPKIPMVVLIDGNSASASEIVAACLQDHRRAAVVGTRSYGKGTVQNVIMMEYGKSALKLTTARYYRPSGRNIHRTADATDEDEWGVVPDEGMLVTLSDDQLRAVGKRWRRAAYPVWEDREINSLSDALDTDVLETDELTAPIDPPLELPPRDEAESATEPSEATDEPASTDDPEATSDAASPTTGENTAEPTEQAEDLPVDDPMVDPQLKRAVEYLESKISKQTKQRAA